MSCRECGLSAPFHSSGLCAHCTPRQMPKWGIYQDRPCGLWLEWNPAIQIMETTSERRHAAQWNTEQDALHAAAYYELMFGQLQVKQL